MNSQTGAIEFTDKVTGANARVDLDISDLDKEELQLGHVEFFSNKLFKIFGDENVQSVWAECNRARSK